MKKTQHSISFLLFFLTFFTTTTNTEGFLAGTLVKTPIGFTPIEELHPGDAVVSYDFQHKIFTTGYVSSTHINHASPITIILTITFLALHLILSSTHQHDINGNIFIIWKTSMIIYRNSMFNDCVQTLRPIALSWDKSDMMSSIFEKLYPLTKWGKIDWDKIDKKIEIGVNNPQDILPALEKLLPKNFDKNVYIEWDN